jgi:hypothetical protein
VATPLVQPLTREIQIGETTYHVTMHPDRVAIRQKGRRSSVEIPWTELLAFEQRMQAPVAPAAAVEGKPKAPSRGLLNEIAQQLRAATAMLATADDTLTQAGALPAALMSQAAADPRHGPVEYEAHWFVEPLLTLTEVASILRVTPRTVQRLGLRTVRIGGEDRFQQSVIREYLRQQEVPASRYGR